MRAHTIRANIKAILLADPRHDRVFSLRKATTLMMPVATPLVSTITSYLAPSLINRMASSLGLGQSIVGKALQVAVPSILAGIAASVTKSGGTTQLARVLAKNDASTLRTFATVIGSSSQELLMDGGANALVALLGVPSSNVLASAVGRHTGLNPMQSSSLLGLVTPVVLGHLSQAQRTAGLDANGLARQLVEQASAFTAAMPQGFTRLIADSGLIAERVLIASPEPRPRPPSEPHKAPEGTGAPTQTAPTVPTTAVATPLAPSTRETTPLTEETAPAMTMSSTSAPTANSPSNTDGRPSIAATIEPGARVYAVAPAPKAFAVDPALRAAMAVAPSIRATIAPPEAPPQAAPVLAPRPLPPLPPIVAKPAPSPSDSAPIALSRPSIEGTLAPGAQAMTVEVPPPAPFAPVAKRPDIAPSIAATLPPVSAGPPGVAGRSDTPAITDVGAAVTAATTTAAAPTPTRVDVAAVAAAATVVAEIVRTAAPSLAASASKPSVSATMPPTTEQQKQTAAEQPRATVEPKPEGKPAPIAAVSAAAPAPAASAVSASAISQQFKVASVEPPHAEPITAARVPVSPQPPVAPQPTVPQISVSSPKAPAAAAPSGDQTAPRVAPDAGRVVEVNGGAPKRKSDPWEGVPPPPSRALGVLKRLTAATLVGAALGAGLWGLAIKMPKLAVTTSAVTPDTAVGTGAEPTTVTAVTTAGMTAAEPVAETATETAAPVPSPDPTAPTLALQSLDRLSTVLSGVTDEATARAAVAELDAISRDVKTVRSAHETMTADDRSTLSQLVKSKLQVIVPAAEKALGVEGAGALISPVLSQIMADFDVLTGA